ncbi:MAG: transporter [Rhizobiaceae bacterium]|nr:MAG: transporter [Rhizobiaceae bacterium]CAG1009627.1 hypothetical protein RHIZO_03652 [Rhizobiaceae bacterium]
MAGMSEIQRSLVGAWRLMTGRADGLRLLDISADGFWNSFFAIPVALPALAVGWLMTANGIAADGGGGRLSTLASLAIVDLSVWIAPLVVFVAVAPQFGLSDRVAHLVVAYNWGEALMNWLALPVALFLLVFDVGQQTSDALMLFLFILLTVLGWRLVTTAIGRGAGVGSAVFAGLFVVSLVVLITLERLMGIFPADQLAG